ncbi:MAG: hypothetical protein [Caudoviricetes sp.]|nr:MAG: hypothetical protein [Caudoviricetes sp.]
MYDHNDIDNQVNKHNRYFDDLEQRILVLLAENLNESGIENYDQSNILSWQVEQLTKDKSLVEKVAKLVNSGSSEAINRVVDMLEAGGEKTLEEIDKQLYDLTNKKVQAGIESANIIDSYTRQANENLSNLVKESLLSRNSPNNSVSKMWSDVITQSSLEVATGLKTPERALRDNVYRMAEQGVPSTLTDKGGKNWRLSSYSRMVINTTAHSTFNDLRLKRMSDYSIGQAYMSAHPAARRACSSIQGKVVNVVPSSDESYDDKYDSIYNHGYGTAGGTQGANCKHMLTPFIPGTNTEPDDNVPSPKEANENADIQAKQRGYERSIRNSKSKLEVAKAMGDEEAQANIKNLISRQQARLRELVNQHDFLHRQYAREQVIQ